MIFVQESRITWYRERLKKSESLIPTLIPTLSDAEFELNESHVTNLAVSTLSDEILQISAEPVKSNVMEMNPETCPIKDNTDWDVKIKSIYRTDPEKFLTFAGLAGPNNQLRGFREMVFMAVKLNRTIITAPFFKHSYTDPTADGETLLVPDFFRIDVSEVRKLIPTHPGSAGSEICGQNFGAVYQTRGLCSTVNHNRLKEASVDT